MEEKYSVLMSVYYKENQDYLKVSIESMLNQTIKPDEFVIVEDGPLTKELDAVIKKYQSKNPKLFNIVKLRENKGLGLALKKGIESCKNELIARMDSDDYAIPTRIETELNIFKSNPEIDLVGSNVDEFIDNINNVISHVVLPENNEEIIKYSKKRNPFRHPSIMFKKSKVLSAGNYRDYYLCEDYDMWVRMIRNGTKCYNVQSTLVYMRISDDFYKRRGGIKYLKSINKFKKEQLIIGYFSKTDYLKSIIPHAIVCLMPNNMRDYIYKNFLRKK